MGRSAYIRKRLVLMVFVLFGVTVVIFGMVRVLPGDPAFLILGDRATDEKAAELRETLELLLRADAPQVRPRAARRHPPPERLGPLSSPARPGAAPLSAAHPRPARPDLPHAPITHRAHTARERPSGIARPAPPRAAE